MRFRNTIGARMIYGSVLIFLIIIATLMLSVDYYLRDLSEQEQAAITKVEQAKVQNLVHTMALSLGELSRGNSKQLSEEELRRLVGEHTSKVWYSKTGYFYVYDMKGMTIALPPERSLEGKSRWELTDPSGKFLLKEMVEIVKTRGEGFLDYDYKNPQTNELEKKFAYIEKIPGTEWLIGSGSYYSGVDSILGETRKQFLGHLTGMRTFMLCGALASLLLAALMTGLLTRRVSNTLKVTVEKLSDHIARSREMSVEAASISRELANAASEQAASVEEIGSSLEEMASMTRQNADSTHKAKQLMGETVRVAGEAADTMKDLTVSMQEISSASEETQKIIKTIDEIAFQTNLLALNAAVEAARAGEAGAGFAVVAEEVRNLAMRAAGAAKNTADLIESTVIKVQRGTSIVAKTSGDFGKVIDGTGKVGGLLDEIAVASNEQAQGIEQISRAVSEMDKHVQGNSGTADKSAAAGEQMGAQALQMEPLMESLLSMVGKSGKEKSRHGGRRLPLSGGSNKAEPKALPGGRQS